MHVAGFYLDLYWFFQFFFTAFLVGLGLLHLLKNASSKYFVVDASFDEGGGAATAVAALDGRPTASDGMLTVAGDGDACALCGNSANKKCSGCKAVRYCSQICQEKHWKSMHKEKCKELRLSGYVYLTPSIGSAGGRRAIGYGGKSNNEASSDTGHGTCMLQQSNKVLFPYDEFVKLFNWDKPGFLPCGLLNCGNSCFANVVLQCLACTRPLVAYLLEKGHRRECRRNDWCFLCELQSHVERASQSLHPFSPINILSRLPNIGGNLGYGKQEDAHEFMRFAIDTMQSVCLDEFGGEKALHPSSQETTLIQHIFGGHLQSQVICTKCNKVSNRYENMMDLTVEIQGDAASLENCLEQFTVKEWLDGENMYKCDGCNDYVKAGKRLTIFQAPNILTIALKRFQSGRFGKLNKKVSFPETLDLGQYMSEGGNSADVYTLYAVVVHVDMLNASYFGHYICYTKDFRGNWYRIDDCKVMTVELEEVLSQGAYMLLYSRICVREPCVKPLEPLGKEGQLVGETQETGPCSQLPIETFIATDSVNPLGPPGLPFDVSHSKEDMPKGELSLRVGEDSKATREGLQDMDLHGPVCTPAGSVNPVCTPGGLPSNVSPSKESIPDRVLSLRASEDPKSMRQGPKDIGLFNPGSCSFSSKDLECCSRGCFSCQTHTVEIASPVEFTHKGVPYLASSNEVSSIEAHSLESELSSSTADVESSFKEGIGADSNYGKDLLSLQTSTEGFLSSQNNAHEMAETSFEVSGAALSSVAETLCETNHPSSESLPNLSLEQVVTIKSGKCSPAALSTAIKISKLAGDNSLCRGNMKPLFSPGFLNKSTRNRSLKRHEKAQPCEVGSSGKVDHSCNGFSKPCFSYQNSDEVNDHGRISLNCGSLLASPSFIETQSDICLNKDEEENKEAGEVGDCCNNDECNGDVVSILSDKNGSNNFNCDTGQEKFCGNGKDHLVGYRVPEQWPINNSSPRELNPPSSPGFLVNHDGKISSNLDGKAQTEPADVGSACMVDMNCNRIVEPGFPHPNIGEVNDHGAIDLDSNNKLSSRFVQKQPKNSLNKDEMVNKELGEVGKPCNGSCRRDHGSVLSDENGRNIYNRDAGQETFYGNGRDQLIDCRRPLLSARYNDEPLKRNSLKIGEDRELSETIHHPKNETNCKRLADGGW